MAEGGQEAVRADEEVVPISRVRDLENRVRELERLLGRKTMETEILRESLEQARPKNVWPAPSASPFPRPCLISLRQRIRSRGIAPAKMEIRASRSS
jgi:transposase